MQEAVGVRDSARHTILDVLYAALAIRPRSKKSGRKTEGHKEGKQGSSGLICEDGTATLMQCCCTQCSVEEW